MRLFARCGAGWSCLGHGHRLALLVAVSVAPLLLLLAADAVQQHRHKLAAVRARAAELSRQGAEQANDAMQEASNLLRVLVRVPDVANLDGERCHPLLKEVVSEHPRVGSLSAIASDGTVMCASSLATIGIRVADRAWFQEAMRPSAPRIGFSEMLVSRSTRRPAVIAAAPLPWPAADVKGPGVVAASMDVDWFTQLGERLAGSRDSVVQIVDARQGRLIARHPAIADEELPLGGHPLLAAMRAQPGGGTAELAGFDGIERIYAFAPLPSGADLSAYLLVGISRDAALQDARRGVATSLAFALEATVAALLLAWLVARACVTRPLQKLTDAAARLAGGDLEARVGPRAGGGPEVATLAAALDGMAAELQERERAVAESERRFRLLAENSSDMISLLDASMRRTYVSPASRRILGREPEELIGLHVLDLVIPEDRETLAEQEEASNRSGETVRIKTFRAYRKDGTVVWLHATACRLPDGSGWVSSATDVTGLKQAELRLEEANRKLHVAARQDALTGLPNRRAVDELMGREWRRARRMGAPLSVLLLDVDHFKGFNDRYGHPAGDACLRAVAGAIRDALLRPDDVAARYGGEEFVILLPGTDLAGAVHIAGSVLDAVRSLGTPHEGSPFGRVTASVGVASVLPGEGAPGPADLVEAADGALYAAKRGGRNQVLPAPEPDLDPAGVPGLLPAKAA